jgi:predicted HTH transcriptional regulator
MTVEEVKNLLLELAALPHEAEWVEFKENNGDPREIGEYISALANSATLVGRPRAYIAWGVRDGTHEIVGTEFRPRSTKVGNEELENWLARGLSPRLDFRFHEGVVDEKPVVVLEIPAAAHTPARFGEEFVRVGSYKKKLRDYPEKERTLWMALSRTPFEQGVAKAEVAADEVLRLIDYPTYFELTGLPLPNGRDGILERLATDRLLIPKGKNRYDITNLGGILFARNLEHVNLARKGIRVVVYEGPSRVQTIREQAGGRGYAAGFEGLIDFISNQLPRNENIGPALRMEEREYPEIAIRELVANALIHQDFSLTGTGPMVEIFTDRIEITNPGVPLIDTQRFIDAPPLSRNEALAGLMRRLKICEERGSGIDKVFFHVESSHLPAPDFSVTEHHTRAVLFGKRPLNEMSRADRVRACYQHAALQYVSNTQMTNTSLRERLSISDHNYAIASRIIADTLEAGLIKPFDPENRSRKHARYVPFWG